MVTHRHLRLVSDPVPSPPAAASPGDLALTAGLLALGLLPALGVIAGARYGPGAAGAGTALAILSARALCSDVRRYLRARSRGA